MRSPAATSSAAALRQGNELPGKAAPITAPSDTPTATMAKSRSPCSLVYRSLAKDQNCATIIRLKMPTQRKNTTAHVDMRPG